MRATHCWQVDGAWRVGSVMRFFTNTDRDAETFANAGCPVPRGFRLMSHHHTGKIEAVPVAWLKAYPREEIKQP